jgi:hypothetical protein
MLTLPEDASDDPTKGVFSYSVKQRISSEILYMPFPSPKDDGSLGRQYSDAYLILSGSTEAEVETAVAVWEEVFVCSNECRCLMADVITHVSEVVCQDATSFQAIAKLDFSRLEGDSALWVPPWKKSLYFKRVGGGACIPRGNFVFCKRDVVIGYTPGPSSMPCSDMECFGNFLLEPGLPLTVQSFYYDKTTCRIRSIFVKITSAENPDKCYALSGMEVVADKYYVPKRVLRGGMVEMVPENPLDFQETKWSMHLCPGRSSPYKMRLKHPDVNLYRELWDADYLFDFFFEHDVPYEVLQCTVCIGYDIDLELEDMAMDMVEK